MTKANKSQTKPKTLAKYIETRVCERQKSESEYHSFWARVFRDENSATNKTSAARKYQRALDGEQVNFNDAEIDALNQGRLGDIIKNLSEPACYKTQKEALEYKRQMLMANQALAIGPYGPGLY
jgi:hypothetical protein